MNGDFIGYIGFNGDDSALEPEIYIFKQYRNMGYGTRVLRRFIDIVFKYGLEKKYSEETKRIDSVYSPRYANVIPNTSTVFPQNLYATVRVENEFSKRMMLACGFRENKEETIFRLIIDKDDSESGLIHVSKFEITKEEYQKRG
jgi:RimJ/RimL family protein N-acetyltransferase